MIHESTTTAFYHLFQRNKRRYGGFIIHAGVALLFIGIASSSFYRLEKDAMVRINESFQVGAYKITFRALTNDQDPNKEIARAKLEIERNGKAAGFLYPERYFYKNSEQPTTEVALRPFWNEDLYLILAGWDNQGSANFRVFVNPFIGLLWWGGILMAFGGGLVLLPAYKPSFAVSRELGILRGEETA
jgi:cytochrome c-type biogenesis protein CcmF